MYKIYFDEKKLARVGQGEKELKFLRMQVLSAPI